MRRHPLRVLIPRPLLVALYLVGHVCVLSACARALVCLALSVVLCKKLFL